MNKKLTPGCQFGLASYLRGWREQYMQGYERQANPLRLLVPKCVERHVDQHQMLFSYLLQDLRVHQKRSSMISYWLHDICKIPFTHHRRHSWQIGVIRSQGTRWWPCQIIVNHARVTRWGENKRVLCNTWHGCSERSWNAQTRTWSELTRYLFLFIFLPINCRQSLPFLHLEI